MKRGTLNFLGRKNPSLFDTNIKMKDMDSVELVLASSAIPESGTASVRARPTVKHHLSSSDSFQGFAVPTPTVPVLPTVNGPKTNGLVSGDRLSNGSVISVPDLVEGEIFVPPPPSMAPPPPPANFIPPPPDFVDVLNSPDLATIQPPSMPAPKLTSATASIEEEDLSMLKPPPMAPPRPPSSCSSGSASSMCSPPLDKVPEHPKFAPPQPPAEKQHKTHKTPPPKPIRMSSVSSLDSPPLTPAPPPPVQTTTFSTFNPQNTAKLYTVSKSPLLSGYDGRDKRPKQMLYLEDTGSVNSAPVLVQVDAKAPKVTTPSKPVSKDAQEPKEHVSITKPPQIPLPEPNKEAKPETVSAKPDITTPVQPPPQKSPQPQTASNTPVITEPSKDKLKGSPSPSHKFSPLLDHKLRNLKGSESSGAREGPAASPLALLLAAKEREKNRSIHSLSREGSRKKNEQSSTSIHQSDWSPNSFIVIPRSTSSSSLTSTEERLPETSKSVLKSPTPEKPSSPAQVRIQIPSNSPAFSRSTVAESPVVSNQVEQEQNTEQSPSQSLSAQLENNKEDLNVPLLPPPPEFGDFDEITEQPPSILPPDPPVKTAPPPTMSRVSRTPAPPPPPPKPTPPPAPKLPPPDIDIKPKPPVQTKPKPAPTSLPSTLSPSQATLLSILQKKMLEMDHKIAPARDTESSSDDWGNPLSDEDNKVPVVPRAKPQTKGFPVVNKTATLDMRELESKVVKKATSSNNVPTSNGQQSKQQYGRTFTVRPGTKQPITLVSKEES